jgi:hypothetical protein
MYSSYHTNGYFAILCQGGNTLVVVDETLGCEARSTGVVDENDTIAPEGEVSSQESLQSANSDESSMLIGNNDDDDEYDVDED